MSSNVESRGCKVEVTIRFNNLSDEQLVHLLKAEDELEKAGLKFDRGHDPLWKKRVWEFDWSLKGASVLFVRFWKKEKKG